MKKVVRHIILISFTAFVVHLVWETAQCNFFVHLANRPTMKAMVEASAGDVLLTWVAYIAVAVVVGNRYWSLERWTWVSQLSLAAMAVALSTGFELFALETGRWAYRSQQPIIPVLEVGLTPILQLLLLFPLTFAISRYVLMRVAKSVP